MPRTKCCTDPVKSGQSYTIPLGYTDRLGTMRIGEKPVENIPIPIQRPIPIPSVEFEVEEIKIAKRARRTKKEMDNARQM